MDSDSPSSPGRSSRYIDRSRLVACRECRRSKIRCSRTFPCDACTRRGCTDICPDGIKETKRSKSDESLLQENARLVRRIRKLEGILSSLKHSASPQSSPYTPYDPASPSQRSELSSPDASEASQMDDPGPVQVSEDASDSESFLTKLSQFAEKPDHSTEATIGFGTGRDPTRMSEVVTPANKSVLTPGCQFTLRALLELYRACGLIDHRNNPASQDAVAFGDRTNLFSSPSPLSSASPPTPSSIPEAPLIEPCMDVNSFNADQDVWNQSNGAMSTNVSSSPSPFTSVAHARAESGGNGAPTTFGLPDQNGSPQISIGQQPGVRHGEEPMSFELCQRLLIDLGIVSAGSQGLDSFM